MPDAEAQVVVAGHICLDIIPALGRLEGGLEQLLSPGSLVNIGPAVLSTGGAVPNAGLALHRLGVRARLMGKIGDDLFGRAVLDLLGWHDPSLAEGMIVAKGEHTSYTLVVSPPGVDRMFLHCPGANDTFGVDDLDEERLAGARLFHFGYPPIMRRMYADGGRELAGMLKRVKELGLTTCLDMAKPDPGSESGRADWPGLLRRALPYVDIFMPSLDETLFMLDRPWFERLGQALARGEFSDAADGAVLAELAERLLGMGAAAVALKLGGNGLYLRTTCDAERLGSLGVAGPVDVKGWTGRELLAPCFQTEVAGATGSGDCTIAGFLAGLIHGLGPEGAITAAVAVGACSVEQADATSGVRPWDEVQDRVAKGWPRAPVALPLEDWRWDSDAGVWFGPADQASGS